MKHSDARYPDEIAADIARAQTPTAKEPPSSGSERRLVRLSWEYSRNQRRHTAYDETGEERFWITSEAPCGEVQGLHGYRLKLPTGKRLEFGHTVAYLKGEANHRANATCPPTGETEKEVEK